MKSKNLLITSALKDELTPIKNGIKKSLYCNLDIQYFISGIGKNKVKNRLLKHLENNPYDSILNIGTAGSLSDKHSIGDIVFPTKLLSFFNRSLSQIDINQTNFSGNSREKQSTILTVLKPIAEKEERESWYKVADIVDMESYWIAKICRENDLEFHCIKVISDYSEGVSLACFKKTLSKNMEAIIEPVNNFLEAYNS